MWGYFVQLDETRQKAMDGVSPITHQEITAWSIGMQINLLPIERRLIRAIDREYILYSKSKKSEN